jgi:membrane-associated phospholipid phosphatase
MFITIRWKISVHMTSWGGLTGFLLVSSFALRVDILMLILISILLAGALGSSRIILKAHTPAQVYAGYLLGVFGMLLVYSFL